MDPVLGRALELLERSISYTRVTLHGLTEDELDNPTPCEGWVLGTLLAHMVDSLAAVGEAGESGRVGARPVRIGGVDLAATLRAQACGLLASWTQDRGASLIDVAGSPMAAVTLVTAGSLEIAVHGWDVAAARGHDCPLPRELARDLIDVVPAVVSDDDRPDRFGEAIAVAGAAPADVRLLAVLGRRAGGVPHPS